MSKQQASQTLPLPLTPLAVDPCYAPALPCRHISFQPRLSIISGTLVLMLPDMAHYTIILLIVIAMVASLACIVFGESCLPACYMGVGCEAVHVGSNCIVVHICST